MVAYAHADIPAGQDDQAVTVERDADIYDILPFGFMHNRTPFCSAVRFAILQEVMPYYWTIVQQAVKNAAPVVLYCFWSLAREFLSCNPYFTGSTII
jgi:hypothetical protein